MFVFLFIAAVLSGALNAVAGGGSFISLPALLYAGVPAVSANATTTFALWPGAVASAFAYRSHYSARRASLVPLMISSLIGGLIGGLLLVRTSDSGFLRLLPWLMLLAALTFSFSGAISTGLRGSAGERATHLTWIGWVLQLAIAIYGGYFGGGMGIMMMAALAMTGMTDILEIAGVKAMLGSVINGVALVEFVVFGAVDMHAGLVMAAGSIVGGYTTARLARRVPQRYLRSFIVTVAWGLTVYFFYAAYLQSPGQ